MPSSSSKSAGELRRFDLRFYSPTVIFRPQSLALPNGCLEELLLLFFFCRKKRRNGCGFFEASHPQNNQPNTTTKTTKQPTKNRQQKNNKTNQQIDAATKARLMGAAQQIGHLQQRIEELETDVSNANVFVQQAYLYGIRTV